MTGHLFIEVGGALRKLTHAIQKRLKDKILKTLIDAKKLTKEEVDEAIALQKKKGIGFDKALIEKGHVKEQDLLAMLVRELNIPFINLSKYKIDPELQARGNQKNERQGDKYAGEGIPETGVLGDAKSHRAAAYTLQYTSSCDPTLIMKTNAYLPSSLNTMRRSNAAEIARLPFIAPLSG
mgnify:CR=1 FL=1